MKKVYKLIIELLIVPTQNVSLQAFRALFVGVIAFIADAGTLWLLSLLGIHYLISAIFGFVVGVFVNFILSTKFVFATKASVSKTAEIGVYVAVSLVGLGLTELLMWLFTEKIGLYYMLSKCVAALIAFSWNFTSRKLLLYRNKENMSVKGTVNNE
ncbi:MAG: GtrA family protein [Lachnospiraceae bacterium]|jgi:putative flippase GtrA|nr:GtrA family protein [Lachnospiraceae bacterium]